MCRSCWDMLDMRAYGDDKKMIRRYVCQQDEAVMPFWGIRRQTIAALSIPPVVARGVSTTTTTIRRLFTCGVALSFVPFCPAASLAIPD